MGVGVGVCALTGGTGWVGLRRHEALGAQVPNGRGLSGRGCGCVRVSVWDMLVCMPRLQALAA